MRNSRLNPWVILAGAAIALASVASGFILASVLSGVNVYASDKTEEITVSGKMPGWNALLTHKWQASDNKDITSASLVAELEGAENGKAFLEIFGDVREFRFSTSKQAGAKAKLLLKHIGGLAVIVGTAGIALLPTCEDDGDCGEIYGHNNIGAAPLRLEGFKTGFWNFKIGEKNDIYYFVATSIRDQDKGKSYKVYFDAHQ